jgi:hypothetical protein
MIKANATMKDGRNLVILGLSEGNIQKLKLGKPIQVDLEPFGGTGAVVILYGSTEADITRDLATFLTLPS